MKKRVVGIAASIAMLAAAVGVPQGAVAEGREGLIWGPCEGAGPAAGAAASAPMECATLQVPLDYDNPYQTINIALNRIRGRAAHDRLGALLVNPGGPGASGRELVRGVVAGLPGGLADRFDVVGFDPRGVGASEPALRCVAAEDFYRAPRPDQVPADRRDESVLIDRARGYAQACGERWGWMLPHMTTENSARDMDLIRAALGESKISFLGYSYGTYLGAVYATLFPDRLRRLVLDSVVDPRGIWYRSNLTQSIAFQSRHRDFLKWTARHNPVYRIGATEKAVAFAWDAMRARLAGRPAGGVVGPSELDDIYTVGGYSDVVWPQLARAFSAYVKRGETDALLNAYRKHVDSDAKAENSYAVYLAVQCSDAAWPRDWERWRTDMIRANVKAPFLTWPNAWYNAPCAFWPQQGGTPVRVHDSSKLPPILLIQGERDAATPYAGALRMRSLLRGSRLLVVPGGNHGVSLSGNTCVDRRLAAYLRDGVLPGEARRAEAVPDARCPGVPMPVPVIAPVQAPAGHPAGRGDLAGR